MASSSEARAVTLRLAEAEASLEVSEQAHLTFAERARSLQVQVEVLTESLERERGMWSEERRGLEAAHEQVMMSVEVNPVVS